MLAVFKGYLPIVLILKFFFEVLIQKSLEVKYIVIPIREYVKKHSGKSQPFFVSYVFLTLPMHLTVFLVS